MKRVFLCYAHEDLEVVRKIYSGLRARNLDVWFDKENLGPGLFKRQIEKAILKCRYFVICISSAALKKTGENPGFQDEELQQAYEIARVQPESAFSIVPVRLEDCGLGDHRLSSYHEYNLFNDLETELDHLAVKLGGKSLSDKLAEDEQTDEEKMVAGLHGKFEMFYYAGDLDRSMKILDSIIALAPDDSSAWANKGLVLYEFGRYEDAIEAYDKALLNQPWNSVAWYNKGNAFVALGLYEHAIAAYDFALEMNPLFQEALINRHQAIIDSLGLPRK